MRKKLELTEGRVVCCNPQGMHHMVYFDSAPEDNSRKVVLCVHGLLRNHKDFLPLANFLDSSGYRVILVDIVGRGQSDYLGVQKLYSYNQYVADINTLLNKLKLEKFSWLGTSMGGLIGVCFAAHDIAKRVDKLIINDISPRLTRKTLNSFFSQLSLPLKLKNSDLLNIAIERTKNFFSPDEQHLVKKYATNGLKKNSNGEYVFAYDPAIFDVPWYVKKVGISLNLLAQWQVIKCPIYVFKGEKSPLLTNEHVRLMQKYQPNIVVHEVANVGHAPSLAKRDQQNQLLDWLSS